MGHGNGWAPDAYHYVIPQIAAYPDQVVLTTLQNSSGALSNADSDSRELFHQLPGRPAVLVDGVEKLRSVLEIEDRLAVTANCGLAIDAQVASDVEVRIHCFNTPLTTTTLSVWLIESSVTSTDQRNWHDAAAGHTYEGAGNPIPSFDHRGGVRDLVTDGAGGEVVDLSSGTIS